MSNKAQLIEITSDSIIHSIDRNFRIFAGPGAGKTHWLVNHLQNVLRTSKRINRASKIACISYTTVAANEMRDRFNKICNSDAVEFSTIHSFLYKNLVKPYANFLTYPNGLPIINIAELDGHEENTPSFGKINKLVEQFPDFSYIKMDIPVTKECLRKINWTLLDGEPKLCLTKKSIGMSKYKTVKRGKTIQLSFPSDETKYQAFYLAYKKMFWDVGTIHHDDVLYFSYEIIKKYKNILNFLIYKFPYIFVDEFQDTNPLQTEILKWFSESGTIIGTIGDIAQSIYSFQGSKPKLFQDFTLENQTDYEIKNNRRSTDSIISLLNAVRTDVTQFGIRQVQGNSPYIVVGENHINNILKISEFIKNNINSDFTPAILTRKNEEVAKIRANSGIGINIWKELSNLDSNENRFRFLNTLFQGLFYAKYEKYGDAITEISKLFKPSKNIYRDPLKGEYKNKISSLGISIELIQAALSLIKNNPERCVAEFYNDFMSNYLKTKDIGLTKIQKGKPLHEFISTVKVKDLMDCFISKEDQNPIRTIHNAKGAEFDDVILCLEKQSDINYIISPSLYEETDASEECRVIYVALSRARNNLFLSVPSLSTAQEIKLMAMGFKFINKTQ